MVEINSLGGYCGRPKIPQDLFFGISIGDDIALYITRLPLGQQILFIAKVLESLIKSMGLQALNVLLYQNTVAFSKDRVGFIDQLYRETNDPVLIQIVC